MNKTITQKLLSFCLASCLVAIGLGNWMPIQAEEPEFSFSPIAIPFDSSTDGSAFIPSDRETSQKPYDKDRVVLFPDDRVPVTTRKYPWSAIGRVEKLDSRGNLLGWCTGTLIKADVVLTNAHCLIDEKTKQPTQDTLQFRPSLLNGRSIHKANVIGYEYGTNDLDNHPEEDWALFKIDKPLGDRYGHMGWRSLDFADADIRNMAQSKLKLVGYSYDFPQSNPGDTPGVHDGCSIVGVFDDGQIAHLCDTNSGASGSAIFGLFDDGTYNIVGLHSGSAPLTDGSVINRGVQVSHWSRQAREMQ
jgi:protease YdgD